LSTSVVLFSNAYIKVHYQLGTINSLSVIVPAFNEELALNDVLDEIISVLDCTDTKFEIVVINDGSTDGSSELLSYRSSVDARIKSINHEKNYGKGKALRTGIENASGFDWTLLIDADCQIPLTELSSFEAAISNADVIIGNRLNKRYNYYRKSISAVNRSLVDVLFGTRMQDINCPFKLIKTSMLHDIHLSARGFGIDAELLWQLSKNGATIVELPVKSHPRLKGVSKVTPMMLVKCLFELLSIRIRS